MAHYVRKTDAELHRHYYDGLKIVDAFENHGHHINLEDALWAWEQYSDTMCANWLGLPEHESDIIVSCSPFLEKLGDDKATKKDMSIASIAKRVSYYRDNPMCFFEDIDWKYLIKQKETLIKLTLRSVDYNEIEHLDGLIFLIDDLQDIGASYFGEENVFSKEQ